MSEFFLKGKKAWVLGVGVFTILGGLAFFYLGQRGEDFFLKTCQAKLEILNQADPSARKICKSLSKKFFSKGEAVEQLSSDDIVQRFAARPMGIDSQVKFLLFYDPKYLSTMVYCYYVFSGSLKLSQVSPQQLALGAAGFSILKSSVEGYSNWLKGPDGVACRSKVKTAFLTEVIDLEKTLGTSVAVVGLNPVGALMPGKSISDIEKGLIADAARTLNHERIHAVQSICPSLERLAVSEWLSISDAKKTEVIRANPSYNWEIADVAAREYQAIRYENNPQDVAQLAGDCNAQ